ncbi:Methyltransferase type 12 [Microbacterium esteraromaticum]|uniref:Methyltransferase type 12 n=1 Tax=Microbacterium esteraromaticum TaxID=57043 RepID=A0A1R4K0B5_9MICO|nr:PIG-L family deacetylase [Microbacterium esteraromaticum]SJN37901.1 Methyltransferase type 12 [Microbacterium esteraromaticum]
MAPSFDHRDPGTSENSWADAAPWADAAEMSMSMEQLIVFAAHPDDETLGAGGIIAAVGNLGIPVTVVVMTDGESSHPSSIADLRRARRHELLDAVADLAPSAAVHFAGFPDGGLREEAAEVRRYARGLLASVKQVPSTVLAPWWEDGHRDHRVLGEIVRDLRTSTLRVFGYPIWFWHWGDPKAASTEGWHTLPLDESTRSSKARALRRHRSQLEPLSERAGDEAIIHAEMLRHFQREHEVFIAPEELTTVTGGWFEDRYTGKADPWGVDTRWYEQRKRELTAAILPRPRYERVLELACGTGAFTRMLAERSAHVLAVDASAHALEKARVRLGDAPHVQIREMDLLSDWPEGRFDLIVLSEVAYYWSAADWAQVLDRVDGSLDADGVFVVCHWRHPIAGAPLSGDDVHEQVRSHSGFLSVASHLEEDFVLEVFARPEHAQSVAAETGVWP